jgi:hypothetical protein
MGGRNKRGEHWLHRWKHWGRRAQYPSAAALTSDGSYVPYPSWSFADGLELVDDPSPARWVEESLDPHPWATVGNIVPDSFEAYARVLHPAYLGHGVDLKPITWAEVAEMAGTELHPRADFGRLAGLGDDLNAHPEWGQRPPEGDLPREVARPLAEVLRRNTTTPEECWFCVWFGWGSTFALEDYDEDTYKHVKTPGREHLLLRGSIDEVDVVGNQHVDGPSIWWPDDHAWCVATEIDLDSTYVGGARDCIAALLAEPRLETFPAAIDDRLGVDAINEP